MLEKIHIHSGATDVAKYITPYVSIENIPVYLGGNLVDETGDEMCLDRFPATGPFHDDQGTSLLAGLEDAAMRSG